MFRSYEAAHDGFITLIANYLPLQDPYGGPNYFELGSNGVYDINIDNDGDGVADIIFRFQFTNTQQRLTVKAGGVNVPIPLVQDGQIGLGGDPTDTASLNVRETYTMSIITSRYAKGRPISNVNTRATTFEKPVDNIGFKTLPDYAAYAAAHVYNIQIPGCSGNGRAFVGQRKDPFVVNLGETFDLINIANPIGEGNNNAARETLPTRTSPRLILKIPVSCLVARDAVIGAWTTASTTPSGKDAPLDASVAARNASGQRGCHRAA